MISKHEILKQYWGYDAFRPLQEDIIDSVLSGHDTLALLPTGGGKSICFQVPALMLDGLCLVISPLIALMKDQVENLNKRDIPAVAINSAMGRREILLELDNCMHGKYRFLYVSPERLKSEAFIDRIPHLNISFVAVDEAHCISQWGYDFRPEYLQIATLKEHVRKPFLALTATATRQVVADIQHKLGFSQERVYRKSFERPNLSYIVLQEENKAERILKMAKRLKGTGLIYVRNRKHTKDLSTFLAKNGESAGFYHAGLSNEERTSRQESWIKGETRIMVATNAFGMGIDKADVRFVIHYELPDSPEAYYQEAGRAGRDGKRSWCVLLYMARDREESLNRLAKNFPAYEEVKKVYELLYSHYQIAVGAGEGVSVEFDLKSFSDKFGLNSTEVFRAMKVLEQHGLFMMSDAIYRPGSVLFLVDNTTLYDFEIRNPSIAGLIKLMLRTYGGLFDHYGNISEAYLAGRLGTAKQNVIGALQKLAASGILDYQPASDKPRIVFLSPRQNKLFLDTAFMRQRETTARVKLDAMLHYASNRNRCRSQVLMEYFDDLSAENCGHCDICLELKKQELAEDEFVYYRDLIKSSLSKHICTVQSITASVGSSHEKKLLSAIRVLLDEGWLQYNHEGQLQWVEG